MPSLLDLRARLHRSGRRCRAWRPQERPEDHPQTHDPGDCSICWRPCFEPARAGTAFCDECWHQLATHPAVKVRYALLDRDDIPVEHLRHMAMDLDAQVSDAAEMRLETLDEDDELDDDFLNPMRR